MAAGSQVISGFMQTIDNAGTQFIENVYGALARDVEPLFRVMLVFYVIVWGYQIIFGRASISPLQAAERVGRAFFIYTVATQWDIFSTLIYKAATTLPNSVANAIFKAVTTNSNVAADAKSALTTAYNSVYDAGVKLYGSVYTNTYFDFAGALLGLVILVITMLFLALSIGIVLATKLMLLITLSLAPLFIILALFRYTFAFTDGYLRLLANLMTSMVLLYAFIGFYIQLLDLAIQYSGIGSQAATAGDKIERVVPFIFACLVGFYVCMQIPSMASAIAGGIINSTGAGQGSMLFVRDFVLSALKRLKPLVRQQRDRGQNLPPPPRALPAPVDSGAQSALRSAIQANSRVRT